MFVLRTRSALQENARKVGILAGPGMNITDIMFVLRPLLRVRTTWERIV